MSLRIDIATLFPSFFEGPLQCSILKKAQDRKRVRIIVHDLRAYTHDRHRTVDGRPFGGGPGMILKPEPLFECVEAIPGRKWVVSLDPQGKRLTQKVAGRLARRKHLVLVAGHYEGIDQRVREHLVDQEISVGDFVTMGGEAPALCLIEAVARLVPGVLGNRDSLKHETFQAGGLEYPQFTRPRIFRGWKVPDTLVSGNHRDVRAWRATAAQKLTARKRPDLIFKRHPEADKAEGSRVPDPSPSLRSGSG